MQSVKTAADKIGTTADEVGRTAQRLNAKGGPMDRLSDGTEALSQTLDTFSASTLPRLNRVADEATRTVRTLDRAINDLTENPQMLIYGQGQAQPGPGEPGFRSPGVRR
jgi:phospholipid/cholesterol/gamma-HCH transport system substrate-binding protein